MKKIGIVFALSAILLFGTISPSFASVNSHANENSSRAPDFIKDRYIVVLEDDASPQDVAKGHGISPQLFYKKAINGFAGKIPPVALERLQSDSRVKYVEADKIYQIAIQSLPTGIDRIDADTNSIANIDGNDDRVPAVIAVIDTGVDLDHPDLNVDSDKGFGCSISSPLFGGCSEGLSYADDDNGHGTHVAGTAAALDNNAGVVGVAPGATIVPVKVLDQNGSGYLSWILAGIDYVKLKAFYIDVANMSLRGGYSTAFNSAVADSVNAGVVFVVAAGNDSDNASNYSPGSEPSAITVSAIADFDGIPGGLDHRTAAFSSCTEYTDDSLACFSNYGSSVDIAAPGVWIYSTFTGGGYATYSGTSMASPHVAGAAALIRSQDYSLTPSEVFDALIDISIPQNSPDGFTEDVDGYAEPLLYVGDNSNQNQIPIADAGDTQYVDELTTVNLSGTGSDSDGTIVSYSWTQVPSSTVTLYDANTASPSFDAPDVGPSGETLTFSLVVTDNDGANSVADTVDVNVSDLSLPPTIHVGDLEYDTSGKKNWNGKVWITVHHENDSTVTGAVVSGNWYNLSGGQIGSSSCTTDGTGVCQVSHSTRLDSMKFSVASISYPGYSYDSGSNHDADGDSENGTTITLNKGGNSGGSGGGEDPEDPPGEDPCQSIIDEYNEKLASGKKISKKLQRDYDACVS